MKIAQPVGIVKYMPHRISYGETDAMGVLYHAEYLHICERARSFIGREIGFSYKQMEEEGYILPVRELECRYRIPVAYDELIYVQVGVSEWRKVSVRFAYHLYDETKTKLIAEATTLHACLNSEGKISHFPEWIREKFFLPMCEEKNI